MRLVNVCGYNRSGTTLLLRLLDGHPELAVAPVEDGIVRGGRIPRFRLWRYLTEETLLFKTRKQDWRDYGRAPNLVEIRRHLLRSPRRWVGPEIHRVQLAFAAAFELDTKKPLVMKTPKSEAGFDFLFRLDPDARMIYCLRDPARVFASQQAARLDEDEIEPGDTEAHVRVAERFVGAYRRSLAAFSQAMCLSPSQVALVRYEQLIRQTEHEMREIAAFLGVAWDDVLLAPTLAGRPWPGNVARGPRPYGIYDPPSHADGIPDEAFEVVSVLRDDVAAIR